MGIHDDASVAEQQDNNGKVKKASVVHLSWPHVVTEEGGVGLGVHGLCVCVCMVCIGGVVCIGVVWM